MNKEWLTSCAQLGMINAKICLTDSSIWILFFQFIRESSVSDSDDQWQCPFQGKRTDRNGEITRELYIAIVNFDRYSRGCVKPFAGRFFLWSELERTGLGLSSLNRWEGGRGERSAASSLESSWHRRRGEVLPDRLEMRAKSSVTGWQRIYRPK